MTRPAQATLASPTHALIARVRTGRAARQPTRLETTMTTDTGPAAKFAASVTAHLRLLPYWGRGDRKRVRGLIAAAAQEWVNDVNADAEERAAVLRKLASDALAERDEVARKLAGMDATVEALRGENDEVNRQVASLRDDCKSLSAANAELSGSQFALRRRLELARGALTADGFFTPEQVGDDIAPRIAERLAAASAACKALSDERDHALRCEEATEKRIEQLEREFPACPGCGCRAPSDPDRRECGCDEGCNDGDHAPGVEILIRQRDTAEQRLADVQAEHAKRIAVLAKERDGLTARVAELLADTNRLREQLAAMTRPGPELAPSADAEPAPERARKPAAAKTRPAVRQAMKTTADGSQTRGEVPPV